MRYHKLEAVCNGIHFYNFSTAQALNPEYHDKTCSFSLEELAEKMVSAGETKAILILDVKKQASIIAELEKMDFPLWEVPSIKKKSDYVQMYQERNFRFQAKKISVWSPQADLWMVRQVLDNKPWGFEEKER